MSNISRFYELSEGEVIVGMEGCITIKTINRYGDPVELADELAIQLAELLLYLAGVRESPGDLEGVIISEIERSS